MDLFSSEKRNLLPRGGTVKYYGKILPATKANLFLKSLLENIEWRNDESVIFGRRIITKRKVAWHSDGEKDLKENGAIASLSFGAERRFLFRNKENRETIEILLEHGSLLVMTDDTQTNWLHRLPPARTIKTPRVNLTFR